MSAAIKGLCMDAATSAALSIEYPVSVKPRTDISVGAKQAAQMLAHSCEKQATAKALQYRRRKYMKETSNRIRAAGTRALEAKWAAAKAAEESREKAIPKATQHANALQRMTVFEEMGLSSYVSISVYARASAKASRQFCEGLEPIGLSGKRLRTFFEEMSDCVEDGISLAEWREQKRDERDLDELDGIVDEKLIHESSFIRRTQKPHKRKRCEAKV